MQGRYPRDAREGPYLFIMQVHSSSSLNTRQAKTRPRRHLARIEFPRRKREWIGEGAQSVLVRRGSVSVPLRPVSPGPRLTIGTCRLCTGEREAISRLRRRLAADSSRASTALYAQVKCGTNKKGRNVRSVGMMASVRLHAFACTVLLSAGVRSSSGRRLAPCVPSCAFFQFMSFAVDERRGRISLAWVLSRARLVVEL